MIIGGGAVGCEYASIFRALGTDVTLVDSRPQLIPMMDHDVSDGLAASLRDIGVQVLLEAGRVEVARDRDGHRGGDPEPRCVSRRQGALRGRAGRQHRRSAARSGRRRRRRPRADQGRRLVSHQRAGYLRGGGRDRSARARVGFDGAGARGGVSRVRHPVQADGRTRVTDRACTRFPRPRRSVSPSKRRRRTGSTTRSDGRASRATAGRSSREPPADSSSSCSAATIAGCSACTFSASPRPSSCTTARRCCTSGRDRLLHPGRLQRADAQRELQVRGLRRSAATRRRRSSASSRRRR